MSLGVGWPAGASSR